MPSWTRKNGPIQAHLRLVLLTFPGRPHAPTQNQSEEESRNENIRHGVDKKRPSRWRFTLLGGVFLVQKWVFFRFLAFFLHFFCTFRLARTARSARRARRAFFKFDHVFAIFAKYFWTPSKNTPLPPVSGTNQPAGYYNNSNRPPFPLRFQKWVTFPKHRNPPGWGDIPSKENSPNNKELKNIKNKLPKNLHSRRKNKKLPKNLTKNIK